MNIKTPDVSEISSMELQEHSFPSEFNYRITISAEAYNTISELAKESTEVELCGVLIGEVFKDNNGPFLEITNAIKGKYAANQGTQVTFTHETWTHIHNVRDSKFPDKRIVGWYHTHPGFGIFLSPQDMFIHKSFFNQPWHTAFVIDPVSGDEGFFIWLNGKPVQIEQYWVAGKKEMASGAVINSKSKTTDNLDEIVETALKRSKKGIQPFHVLTGLFIITSLLFFTYLGRMNSNLNSLLTSQKEHLMDISQRLSFMNLNKNKSYVKIEKIKKVLTQNTKLADLDIRLKQANNHIWCFGEVYTWEQKELLGKVVTSVEGVESVDLQGIVVTHQYITSPGDNLSKIATRVYGDPNMWTYIFEANRQNIKHPNKIQPFILLSLPEPF